MEEDDLEQEEGKELFEHHSFVSDPKQAALRIDKFLMDRIPNTTRSKLQAAIKDGHIAVNGVGVKANYKIRPNDEVKVSLPYPKVEFEILAEDIPINILFEDEEIIVINKEAGLVVHPGYGNYTGTLVNALMFHFKDLPLSKDEHQRPGLVHRLDKLTTGLMVIAKTENALVHLSSQFFKRTIKRTYHALVWGDLEEEEGTITGHIGRSLKNRKMMDVFPDEDYGKHAVTHWKVLERFNYVTLVECKLETGRTHQIRVHFKHIGHPLFGDFEYGGDRILKGTTFTKYRQFVQNCFKTLPRQALHARFLSLIHPGDNQVHDFESALPEDMTVVLEKWRNYASSSMKD